MAKKEKGTMLAFARALENSDARFTQTTHAHPTQETPVKLREKSVRGTISNRQKKKEIANDSVNFNEKIKEPNLQTVDVATLEEDKDTLIARFTLKALPFIGKPCICSNPHDPDYEKKIRAMIDSYLNGNRLDELTRRYAENIANARWLWRNRIGAEHITITVTNGEETVTMEDVKSLFRLNTDFDAPPHEVATIAGWLQEGLQGKRFILLEVEARAFIGAGQEVFPSQELILDKDASKKSKVKKSKVLYAIDGKAAMHSQKIGNAIRTIDTWYDDSVEFPIAVEPYGAVTTLGTAFRQPKRKNDFYTLFDNWVDGKHLEREEQHYVAAVLIRGGVFGESGKE